VRHKLGPNHRAAPARILVLVFGVLPVARARVVSVTHQDN
jgi:hypothetical protein